MIHLHQSTWAGVCATAEAATVALLRATWSRSRGAEETGRVTITDETRAQSHWKRMQDRGHGIEELSQASRGG